VGDAAKPVARAARSLAAAGQAVMNEDRVGGAGRRGRDGRSP